jgi:hypothetical protein
MLSIVAGGSSQVEVVHGRRQGDACHKLLLFPQDCHLIGALGAGAASAKTEWRTSLH